MPSRSDKYGYRLGASKLHKAVGDVLRTHPQLQGFRSLQEYPVPHTNMHVDWFIMDLNIAIEVQGEQHFQPVRFGGITQEEAKQKYIEQKNRDSKKRYICESNGWKLITFKYDEDFSNEAISSKILNAIIS